jgi:polysaccharide export outer membrane protein
MSPQNYRRILAAALIAILAFQEQMLAQSGKKAKAAQGEQTTEQKIAAKTPDDSSGRAASSETAGKEAGAKALSEDGRQALRRAHPSEEESAVLPYINNYFETLRFGPEDVIAVDVFGHERYSRNNIIVPPDGRISYPLAGSIKVVGRTTAEVERELSEKLSEYIIEPKVTVQLVQSHSQKVLVVGDVGAPGIYEMTRRLTVTEALARAGYITRYGDKSGVRVLRLQPNGQLLPLAVNMTDVERGKSQDLFLVPGDTVVVPGNKFKKIEQILGLATLGAWARTFTR